MTPVDQPSDAAAREKVDEGDHDLLTFGEVGERLRIEISTATAELDRVRHTGSPTEIEVASNRLEALRAAAKRNSAQPLNDANFERFFGYPGKAKRNLPIPPSTP